MKRMGTTSEASCIYLFGFDGTKAELYVKVLPPPAYTVRSIVNPDRLPDSVARDEEACVLIFL
jgi:hypothetical protein